jgi:hydrogenase expression/formation protein HypE
VSERGVADRERRKLEIVERARSRPTRFADRQVTLADGAGGRATRALVEGLLVPTLGSAALAELDDAAPIAGAGADLVITTDSYVVTPIRFPGGSIGGLAVNGTVNDLAVTGARPLALSLSLVLEEGLAGEELRAEVEAIATAAEGAGVEVVAGDLKVVERGRAERMYVCTTGVGRRDPRARLAPSSIQVGDRILLSGTVGDHGTAIMLARGEFELVAEIESDSRSLWPVAEALIGAAGPGLRCMRDATRGGVASVLNELARASGVSMLVRESEVPVRPAVAGAAELLGIDPLQIANEGKLVAFTAPEAAAEALAAMRSVPGSEQAAEIGEVAAETPPIVLSETPVGGRRVIDELVGDPLPRIC